MIKTLRITTIVAAGLAAVLFVLVAAFGFRSDESAEKFLKMPSVIDKFKQAAGQRMAKSAGQVSPLVMQAQAFALHLNPPPPPARPKRVPTTPAQRTPIPKPAVVSAKFTLAGTAYFAANPDQSWALINETAKGLRWVKQGGSVGHLIIQEVKDGLVVVKDGQRTFEYVPERTPKKSLVKSPSSAETGSKPTSVVPPRTSTLTSTPPRTTTVITAPQTTTAEATTPGMSIQEQEARVQQILAELEESLKIGAEEAKKLDNLGRELDARQDPNRDAARKIGSSRRPIVPRRPALPKRPPR